MPESEGKLLLSASEVASALGISRSSFYSLCSSGRIGPTGIKLGGRVLYSAEELRRWVQEGCPARCKWQGGLGQC
jgi:excisionase family DNA binding protein